MANFKTALRLLVEGKLNLSTLEQQLAKFLTKSPQHANKMLAELEEIHEQGGIGAQDYITLKSQINEYRRKHALATEGKEMPTGASTVFIQEDSSSDAMTDTGVDDGATQVLSQNELPTSSTGFDVTGGGEMSGIEVDPSSLEASGVPVDGPAETGWADPSQATVTDGELGSGSIIKQRFKLISVLGTGGMGKVYKGLDLLKEEAKDKKPYVAIKLLNEDFKDHPEAFISLQRESSRQQKLAHPNIATIYDFDRVGGPGTPVFITMELMEGMEIKHYIRKTVRKQKGLPFPEAFTIIKQLVDALSYAHQRRLVHSDFKPGNCFLCNDGTVKILDFGIARAVKNPVTGEAEKTLFDPGKLGALTPAYASYEMLQGEEPDTRDDIYALGCVAYELLTSKHPYNKVPANKAKAAKLFPPIVPGLKKKQNRALQRSVAFERAKRSPTVEHFLTELEAKYIWYKSPLTIAAILFLAIGLGGTQPALNYFHQKEIETVITAINSGNPQTITAQLTSLGQYGKADQRRIQDEAKSAIQHYFQNQIASFTDTSGGDYNFPKAEEVLAKISVIYPDSGFLEEQTRIVSASKKVELSRLYTEYSNALRDQTLLDKTKEILGIIRLRIDPENALLTDPRASSQYRLLANNQFELGNFKDALALITSGLVLAPEDPQLADTKIKIENAIKVAGLQTKLSDAKNRIAALEDYKQFQDDITELAKLSPASPLIASLSATAQQYINQRLETILATGNRAEAEALASEYGALLSALRLGQELTGLKLAHLSGAKRQQEVNRIVSADKASIEKLLAEPQLENTTWESELLANIQELDSLTQENSAIAQTFLPIRQSIAELYVSEARKALTTKRFDTANSLTDRGERFAPGFRALLETRNAIADAKATQEKQLLVDGLKSDFKIQTEANQVVKAMEYLEQLKAEVPEDIFVTQTAPVLLSSSYEQLAKSRFEAKDYINALKFADEGLKLNPGNQNLKFARQEEYVVEANIIELTEQFRAKVNFDITKTQRQLNEIVSSPRFSEFRQNSIKQLETRISTLKTTNENAAAILANNAATLFPGSVLEDLKNELQLKPWPGAQVANTTINAGKLTESERLLQAALAELPEHPEVLAFQELLSARTKEANDAFATYQAERQVAGNDYKKLRAAKRFLSRAQASWTDNPAFDAAESDLDDLILANKPAAKKVIAREVFDPTVNTTAATPGATTEEWKPKPSGRECEKRLAGYGRRAKAICYDLVNTSWRGPLMVVLPAGSEFQGNFAISKYEISVGDYSKYCALTGACTPERNKEKFNDPVRNITLKQAETYAAWVSERSGKVYRLPTSSEWEYAALAGGKQPKKDYNCRVSLGDKVIKGTGVVNVKSGQSNGWGLKNYIGNVQEWVIDGQSVIARGGAFQDPHSKCELSFQRAHSGQPDDSTGFRLVLEDVG